MINRSTRISDAFSRLLPIRTLPVLVLLVIVLFSFVNLESSKGSPPWLREVDFIEISVFVLLLMLTVVTHLLIRQDRKMDNVGYDLGYQRGEPFSFLMGDKKSVMKNTWRYLDSRDFSLEYGSRGILTLVYNGVITEEIENYLKTGNSVQHIIRGSQVTLVEIPGQFMIDDLFNIIEVLQREKITSELRKP